MSSRANPLGPGTPAEQLALAQERLPLHPGDLQVVIGSAEHGASFLVWLRGLARLLESTSARLVYITERRAADAVFRDQPCFQRALECLELQLKLAAPRSRGLTSLDRLQLVYTQQDAGLAGLNQLLVELGVAAAAAQGSAGGLSGYPASQPPRRAAAPPKAGGCCKPGAPGSFATAPEELQSHQSLWVLDWSLLEPQAQLELARSPRKLAWTATLFQEAVAAHGAQGLMCFPPGHPDAAKILRHLTYRLFVVRPALLEQVSGDGMLVIAPPSRPHDEAAVAEDDPDEPPSVAAAITARLDVIVGSAQERAGLLCPCGIWCPEASPSWLRRRDDDKDYRSRLAQPAPPRPCLPLCPVCSPDLAGPHMASVAAAAEPSSWSFRWTPSGGLRPVAEDAGSGKPTAAVESKDLQ